MNISFLIPFICLCLCIQWAAVAKLVAKQRCDDIPFYETPLCDIINIVLFVCLLIGDIIVWINAGFLICLAYIGVCVALAFISQFALAPILLSLFGYSGIGAILPYIGGVASAIWMFIMSGTFN